MHSPFEQFRAGIKVMPPRKLARLAREAVRELAALSVSTWVIFIGAAS
jgi:hypothetical protein